MKNQSYKKFKAETSSQTIFQSIRTEILKERLKHLKKKPKKNKLGIHRIEEELYQRKEQHKQQKQKQEKKYQTNIKNIKNTKNTKNNESLHQQELLKIHEMKNILYEKVLTEPEYAENLRKHSNKIKVLAEIRLNSKEVVDSLDVYGYIIQNISTKPIVLTDVKYEPITLKPGEVKAIELIKFIRVTAEPKISFTLNNGCIKSIIPLSERIKREQEGWSLEEELQQYRFIAYEGKLPIIYLNQINQAESKELTEQAVEKQAQEQ